MRSFAILLVCVAVASCKPATESEDNDVFGSVVRVFKNCDDPESCLKEKAMRYVENLASSREVNLVDGITIIGTGSARGARSYEPLPEDPKARASTVEGRIIDGVADFLENHVVQLRMPKSTVDDVKRSLEEGRGKKKKLKQLLPIFALIQLKLQALIPLFLAIIAFAAIKGLLLAKAAVVASALLLLKKLLSKGESHESYEVVAHPHHDHHEEHHGGHGGGWGRSDAQNLAYNAYAH